MRRRSEQLERELAALKERVGQQGGAGGGIGLGDVFENLGEMEAMMDAKDAREAEKRLRERAKRADARSVGKVMDETFDNRS